MVSLTHALCMRVPGGRRHVLRDGSVGYIHTLDARPASLPPKKERPVAINARRIIDEWTAHTDSQWVELQAASLGVSPVSLRELGACRQTINTTAFPMRDGYGNMVGIRIRADSGAKWAVTGSHQGLFIPSVPTQKTLWTVEGPTNTAAALTLGLFCVGRPSCNGGIHDLLTFIRRNKISRLVQVADNDPDKERPNGSTFNPGLDGANALSNLIRIPIATVMLPCKDMRLFVQQGGTVAGLECLLNETTWKYEV